MEWKQAGFLEKVAIVLSVLVAALGIAMIVIAAAQGIERKFTGNRYALNGEIVEIRNGFCVIETEDGNVWEYDAAEITEQQLINGRVILIMGDMKTPDIRDDRIIEIVQRRFL